MAGYAGYSMSNNAVQAYDDGLLPASKIHSKIPAALIEKFCRYEEWHHASKHYNKVKFYDPRLVLIAFGFEKPFTDEDGDIIGQINPAAIEALANYGSGIEIHESCKVDWLEWSGSRNHPKCNERSEVGCTVSIKGQTATITTPRGEKITKRLSTNGFKWVKS